MKARGNCLAGFVLVKGASIIVTYHSEESTQPETWSTCLNCKSNPTSFQSFMK